MTCWHVQCDSTDTAPYLGGPACPQHTPAAMYGRPEPTGGDRGNWIASSPLTGIWVKGATDINKERPGGYMSKQRAQKIAAQRDAIREAS